MTTVLETEGLTREFGSLLAVDDISLNFDREGVTSIIGPNGAGKTTFYNMLTGTLEPTAGEVRLRTRDGDGLESITGLAPHETSQKGLCRAFQVTNIFEELTVLENIRISCISQQQRTKDLFTWTRSDEGLYEQAMEIIDLLNIDNVAETECGNLSHGDKRKVDIGLALAQEPTVMLLDEPTAGMNPTETERTVDIIENIRAATETAFVITEHDMSVISDISDRIVVLHSGQVIADGEPADVLDDEQVKEAYLGGVVA